jgi:prepilin-type N-terminal cleavage/methylation domain-containing protein
MLYRLRRKKRAGFTLIEVVMSLAVFVIGIVLLFPLFSNSLQMLGTIDTQTTVANLARAKMAEIETIGFQSVPVNTARTAFPDPYGDYDYQLRWQSVATDVAASPNTVLFEAELTIYWHQGGSEKNQKFITYIARQRTY